MNVLEINDLTKLYSGKPAVNNVSVTIKAGERVGLVGANGAGKSTLIRMIIGETPPTSGKASIYEISVEDNPVKSRSFLGYVPQDTLTLPYLTGPEYLEFIAGIFELDKDGSNKSSQKYLRHFHLDQETDKLIRDYSYGMTRKIQMAAALLPKPKLLILDEALNGMDVRSLDQAQYLLNQASQSGSAIILVSHDLYMIEKFCERVLILKEGELVIDKQISAGQDFIALVKQHIPTLIDPADFDV